MTSRCDKHPRNREAPGGRITDVRHGAGEVVSDQVWAVLQGGAPGLRTFCLCGALAWYPAVSEVWFTQLITTLQQGFGRELTTLDLRSNKLRADVAERLQERLWKVHRKDFQLLWDGAKPLNALNPSESGNCPRLRVALFEQVLPSWAATRTATSAGEGGPLTGLRLVDFGSGDGRIVAWAAKKGMHATGYELNPYLVLWSRLRCWRSLRQAPGSGQLLWANAWSADLRDVDVVTVYGRPGDSFMELAAKKMDEDNQGWVLLHQTFFGEFPMNKFWRDKQDRTYGS
eukprot:symbB.v1.2.000899.t1/scaffold27.1/size414596/7